MTKPNYDNLSFKVYRHLDFLDLLCDASVKDITLDGHALVPFIELFEFTASNSYIFTRDRFANIFFEHLGSYITRTEFLHRMNEYLSFRLDQASDWFVTCQELHKGHYTFYRGGTRLLFEFVRSSDSCIIFKLYS